MASNSSSPRVIRKDPDTRLFRMPWWTPEIQDDHIPGPIFYYDALGRVVTDFNRLESTFRHLVGHTAGVKGKAGDALLTHIPSVTLRIAFQTLLKETPFAPEIRDELLFAADLFEACRINRNFLVHAATPVSPLLGSLEQPGMVFTKRSARGAIKVEHWSLTIEALRRTSDEIFEAYAYISYIIGPCAYHDGSIPVTLPSRPPLPEYLAKSHPTGDLFDLVRTQTPPETEASAP